MARPTVLCTKCGTENELTSLFCNDCSAKLDLTKVDHSDIRKSVKRERGSGGNPIFKLIRLVLVLGILALLGFMLWPPIPLGEVGEKDLAKEYESTRSDLIEACKNGIEIRSVLPERAINAYALDVVNTYNQNSGGGFATLSDVNISIDKTEIEVMATMKFGPVPLGYVISGSPVVGSGDFGFQVDRVHVGHLPVPGPLVGFVSEQIVRIFEGLEPERFVLNNIVKLDQTVGSVRFTTRDGSKS
jgi:hypothetical protein